MIEKNKKKVIEKIESGEVKIKSRWFFLARKLGLQSGLALSVILLIIIVNAFFYYIKTNNLLSELHYGPSLWQEVLHFFPYDLVLIGVILILIINFLVRKFEFHYWKPFIIMFLLSALLIIILASILLVFDFNERISGFLEDCGFRVPFMSDFYIQRCGQIPQ